MSDDASARAAALAARLVETLVPFVGFEQRLAELEAFVGQVAAREARRDAAVARLRERVRSLERKLLAARRRGV